MTCTKFQFSFQTGCLLFRQPGLIFLPHLNGVIKSKNYLRGAAGVDGPAGLPAGAGAVGACPAGAVAGAGAAAAGLLFEDMTDDEDGSPERYANVSDVSIKITAAPVVILLKNVVPPPAPKTDWLPLLPKEAPISAPLPDCNNTTAIMNTLTKTCNIVRTMIIQIP
jgi:hypothetical protein